MFKEFTRKAKESYSKYFKYDGGMIGPSINLKEASAKIQEYKDLCYAKVVHK